MPKGKGKGMKKGTVKVTKAASKGKKGKTY